MAVADDVKNAIASLQKITDTIDKIEAVERDIALMLSTTKFTLNAVRVSIDKVVDSLHVASSGLKAGMVNSIQQISLAQGGP